jgi:hypothetical protein
MYIAAWCNVDVDFSRDMISKDSYSSRYWPPADACSTASLRFRFEHGTHAQKPLQSQPSPPPTMILMDEDDAQNKATSQLATSGASRHHSTRSNSHHEHVLATDRDHPLLDADTDFDAPPPYDESTSLLGSRTARRARVRFARALLAAVCIFLASSGLVGSWAVRRHTKVRWHLAAFCGILMLCKSGHKETENDDIPSSPEPPPVSGPPDSPPVAQCIPISKWESHHTQDRDYNATSTFYLDPDADLLQIISIGYAKGTVSVEQKARIDRVKVQLVATGLSIDTPFDAEACLLHQGKGLRLRVSDHIIGDCSVSSYAHSGRK